MEELISRGYAATGSNGQLLTAPEAERLVESMQAFDIEQCGSAKWLQQQEWIEKLNLQAHHNAQMHADEFVKDFLISFDKINTLVHELLVIEVWKEKLLPHLQKHLAKKVNSITTHLLNFHEANVVNLLEVVLYHEQSLEALEEEHLLELVDWCYRKLHYLNTSAYKDAEPKDLTVKALLDQTPVEELKEKLQEVRFGVALCSLSIVRYLTDYVPHLPVSVVNRLLNTNDTLMALLPLVENPPWVRKRKGNLEAHEGNVWRVIPPTERFKLTNLGAQVWLALNNLIVDPRCRGQYEMDEYRKESIIRLKRFMNDLLFDQLPVLKDLQRALDELCLSAPSGSGRGRLVIEQVATIRERLLQRQDWEQLAKKLKKTTLAAETQTAVEERMKGMLQAFEFMADLTPNPDDSAEPDSLSAVAGKQQPPVKVSLYSKVAGRMDPWSELELPIDCSTQPDPVELKGERDVIVRGHRWKLLPVAMQDGRPMPAKGRIAACHAQCSADALLELPAPATKTDAGLADVPGGMWLTVGLLAQDGFALQLRLKRTDAPKERDRADGVWLVYHVTGGAISLLEETITPPVKNAAVGGIGLTELD